MRTPGSPHRRYNPLTDEWVLVSPQRTQRPWRGEFELVQLEPVPEYDPQCFLCPGNLRANGLRNPRYEGVHVFENDYPSFSADSGEEAVASDDLFLAGSERGICKVVSFSPRHDLSFGQMESSQREAVVDAWAQEYARIGALPFITWVQIFENRGAMMGASDPHPHGQLWAQSSLPTQARKEQEMQQRYRERSSSCLLCTYVARELELGERLIYANDAFVTLVPFWAAWPFEALLIARRHARDLAELTAVERLALADAIGVLTQHYDALFSTPLPYSMGFHARPTDGEEHDEWHLHAHYYPPLLRSAQVRKFMVGYEMLAEPQRDLTPEEAAARLRET